MSKITTYLNEHLAGEVVSNGPELMSAAVDGSVLLKRPEMLVNAADTSDIRKVARFCWQLAEKGHKLPITVRGQGTDATGAATGSGVIISTTKYLNRVVGIDSGQKLIHVQAGAPYHGVNMALSTHKGLTLPDESFDGQTGTIGGAIATGTVGRMGARFGTIGQAVTQLEVVLASGDVLQTGKISKRELSAKKGLQTMEGEIYRQIDNLIADNEELIRKIANRPARDTSGYVNISKVKYKDGSLDLTPLFVGSQGSLGIITEVILKAQFARQDLTLVIASYADISDALTAVDQAMATKAVSVEVFDGRLLKRAADQGKKRDFAPVESFKGATVVTIFDDFGEKLRARSARKFYQQLAKTSDPVHLSTKKYTLPELAKLKSLLSVAATSDQPNMAIPGLFRGLWLPIGQIDGFLASLKKLETELKVQLPLYIDYRSGLVDILPVIDVSKVSDRQKIIKLLSLVADVVIKHEGSLSGSGGDGRLKAAVAQKTTDTDTLNLYQQIKDIFDPHGLLNPGVKQQIPPKDIVVQLNDWCRFVMSSRK